jgi:hypothetical protein
VAIIMEVHYKRWVCRDITKVGEQMRRRKILSFNNTWFKVHIKTSFWPLHVYRLFKDTCSYYVENEFLNEESVVKSSDCSLQKRRVVGKLKRSEIPCIIGYTLASVNSRN